MPTGDTGVDQQVFPEAVVPTVHTPCWVLVPLEHPSFCCAGLPCPVQAGYTTWLSLCQHCALPGVLFVPKATLDSATEQWGVKVARVEIKDIRIPMAMQRAMAAEAEAAQVKKAKVRPVTGDTHLQAFVFLSENHRIV